MEDLERFVWEKMHGHVGKRHMFCKKCGRSFFSRRKSGHCDRCDQRLGQQETSKVKKAPLVIDKPAVI